MPVYEYEHIGTPCDRGRVFEERQVINDLPLRRCPECGGLVRKLISAFSVHSPKGDSELRDLGFTKLVRRDEGIYENVTVREGESKIVDPRKPETLPHLHKTITD